MEPSASTNKNTRLVIILVVLALAGLYLLMNKNASAPSQTDQPTATTTTSTSTPTITDSVTSNPNNPSTMDIKIALTALEGNKGTGTTFGCGDKVVLITRTVPYSTAMLQASLKELLSEKNETVSGFYNVFHQSDLTVDSVTITPSGEAKIALKGMLKLGGTCDSPRVQEQLVATAKQFSTVTSVSVTLNGEKLSDVLSQ